MSFSLPALGLFEIRAFKDYNAQIAALTTRGLTAQGRKDLPPHPFRLPFDWHADPFGDRNWMFQLHAWRLIDPHLNRLRHEPDHPRAFTDIHAIIADWHRANMRSQRGRFTWYDMATGLRALRLAYLVLATRRLGTPLPDPKMMVELVERHAAILTDPDRLSPGNHGLFQMNGLMALLWLHPGLPGAARMKRYAAKQMSRLLDRQLGPEGVHTEDAPYYHFFTVKKIARILGAPWWRGSDLAPMRARLAHAEAAANWLADPAGRCVPIGDSDESVLLTGPPALSAWPHIRRGAHLGAALDGYGVVRSAPDVPPERSRILFLTASFHAHGHKHADCLSFVWQEAGHNILIDSGKYGYERNAMRDYFVSTCAHSTVEIGIEAFDRAAAHAYGSGLRRVTAPGETWVIEAEADRRHVGAMHRRSVFYRPGRFVLAVDHIRPADGTTAETGPQRFTSWWHFDPDLDLTVGVSPGIWWAAGLPEGRRVHITHVANAGPPQGQLHLGEMTPRIQGWVSRSYLDHAPAPVLGFPAETGSGYFSATLFEILEAGGRPALVLTWRPAEATISLGTVSASAGGQQRIPFGAFALEADTVLL